MKGRKLWRPSRRSLVICAPALLLAKRSDAAWTGFAASRSNFPGQAGNPVGYLAEPNWPGSFQSTSNTPQFVNSGGSPGSPLIIAYKDFQGTGDTTSNTMGVSAAWVKFVGCRFQGNNIQVANVKVVAEHVDFSYCSFTPLTSFYTAPPNAAWPSAGAGLGITNNSVNYNSFTVADGQGYQYGIDFSTGAGNSIVDHCDFWGFGNGLTFETTTGDPIVMTDCWIHDSANSGTGGINNYHNDGIGYLNGINHASFTGSIAGTTLTVTAISTGAIQLNDWINGSGAVIPGLTGPTQITAQLTGSAGSTGTYTVTPSQTVASHAMTGTFGVPPSNISARHCTIASIGNTNGIAYQNAGPAYSGLSVINCYLSGFSSTVDMGHNVPGNNNFTFTDNIFGTDNPWLPNPIYIDFSTQFSQLGNLWRRNRLRVLPGTSPAAGASFSFTALNDGNYLLPDITLNSTTDWPN
jgi:hypothetical protein